MDVARMQTLSINLDKTKGRIPDAIRQAYCTVVTVSDKNEVQAFKVNVTDEPHFTIINNDTRSRKQDSSISSEALLPDGPYDLWREGETSRRVKDLSGSFAQLPHLPKMLKAQAIIDTLVEGCQMGAFVLRLTRPDGSSRTWWYMRPDETAMNDPSLELILSEAKAMLHRPPGQISAAEILPETLRDAWKKEEATALSIATALSQKLGRTLPWKTVSDVVSASINARFTQLDPKSGKWPCEYPSAQGIELKVSAVSDPDGGYQNLRSDLRGANTNSNILVARSELKADQIQDLGDIIPKLLDIKNKAIIPMAFQVQIELGDGETQPDDETIISINRILGDISDGFKFVK